jgi:hypothetical protein
MALVAGANLGADVQNNRAGNLPPLQDFFGTLSPDRSQMLAQDAFARETYNLPKAYEGRNLFLENVLDYLITNESDWYTTIALPWVKTDQLSVQWEIFRFNKTLFDLEPEQGPPRYVSAEREARSDRLVRRGLGFIIEHGFYETEEGRQHYLMNLRQISDSVHETAYFGVMSALLTAHDYYKAHKAEHGPVRTNFGELTRQERNRWAIVQKDEHGLHMLDAEIKHEMRRHGREHNMIVLPDATSMYVTMVPEYQKEDYRHGPGVADNLNKGEDNMLTFRGSRVVESKPFDIDFIGEGIDLLLRERQIGEYFVMPATENEIKIYSADTDKFEVVRRADFNGADKVQLTPEGYQVRGNNVGAGRLIIVRPFQRYVMGSALFLNGGQQLGATYHGHHNFMLSDDIVRKVHVGHYTFYHKSIIKDDKNIAIAEDIICKDYLGGEGHKPFTTQDLNNARLGNWDLVTGSLIPIVGAFENNDDVLTPPNPLSINGGFDGEPYAARYEPNGNAANDGIAANLLASLFPRNNGAQERFLSDIRANNSVCYQGMQLDMNNRIVSLNTGHWGHNGSGPGTAAVRRGENAFLKDRKYEDKLVSAVRPAAGAAAPLINNFPPGPAIDDVDARPSTSGIGSTAAIPPSASSRRRAKSKSSESGVGGPSI